jgi:hypothetical protein
MKGTGSAKVRFPLPRQNQLYKAPKKVLSISSGCLVSIKDKRLLNILFVNTSCSPCTF